MVMANTERRTRLAHEERRQQIIDAARVVAARGWESFSFISIAREAGVSRQTVYNNFSDLSELVTAVVAEAGLAFMAAMQGLSERLASQQIGVADALEAGFELLKELDPESRRLLLGLIGGESSTYAFDLIAAIRTTIMRRWSWAFDASPLSETQRMTLLTSVFTTLITMSLDDDTDSLTSEQRIDLLARLALLVEGPGGLH
jgi:AcrR family transcriptional regulator